MDWPLASFGTLRKSLDRRKPNPSLRSEVTFSLATLIHNLIALVGATAFANLCPGELALRQARDRAGSPFLSLRGDRPAGGRACTEPFTSFWAGSAKCGNLIDKGVGLKSLLLAYAECPRRRTLNGMSLRGDRFDDSTTGRGLGRPGLRSSVVGGAHNSPGLRSSVRSQAPIPPSRIDPHEGADGGGPDRCPPRIPDR